MQRLPRWTLAITAIAIFMVSLDNLVVSTALVSIREDLGASLEALEWTVNAYTLAFAVFLLTGAALGDRFGRRRMFIVGLGIFTAGVRRRRARPEHRRADRRPRHPGPRRRDRRAAQPHDPLDRDRAGEARPRARHLVGHQRPRRRARPARRRRRDRGHLVALDLLAQRPDRARARPARAAPPRRDPRPGEPARPAPASRSARSACSASSSASCAATRPAGARSRSSGRSPPARSCSSRFIAVGAAHARADAADALLPLARVLGHERRQLRDDVRDVRRDLPARPVLPGRPGLLAARGRPADAALDRHADARRPDRRRAVGPARLAAADGGRPVPPGGRARLAGGRDRDRRRLRRRSSPRSCMGGTGMALVFAPAANAVLGAVRPEEAGQASGANNAIRELGGVLGVAVLAAVFAGAGSYATPQSVVDGLDPRAVGRRRRAAARRAGRAARPGPRARRPIAGAKSAPRRSPRKRPGGRAAGTIAASMDTVATDIERLAARARELGRLGIDTEFMPEGRYRPLLCLIQVCVGEEIVVLDPLGGDGRPRAARRGPRRPGRGDRPPRRPPGRRDPPARVAAPRSRTSSTRRSPPGSPASPRRPATPGCCTTCCASASPSRPRSRAGTRARSRPSSSATREEDVEHLLPLADELQRRLRERGRLEWAREECVAIAAGDRRARPGGDLAAAAAHLRPRPARARDRARAGRVARADRRGRGPARRQRRARPDARRARQARPASPQELGQIRGAGPDVVRRRARDILAARRARPRGRADPARGGRAARHRPGRRPDDRARGVARARPRAGGRPRLRADRRARRPRAVVVAARRGHAGARRAHAARLAPRARRRRAARAARGPPPPRRRRRPRPGRLARTRTTSKSLPRSVPSARSWSLSQPALGAPHDEPVRAVVGDDQPVLPHARATTRAWRGRPAMSTEARSRSRSPMRGSAGSAASDATCRAGQRTRCASATRSSAARAGSARGGPPGSGRAAAGSAAPRRPRSSSPPGAAAAGAGSTSRPSRRSSRPPRGAARTARRAGSGSGREQRVPVAVGVRPALDVHAAPGSGSARGRTRWRSRSARASAASAARRRRRGSRSARPPRARSRSRPSSRRRRRSSGRSPRSPARRAARRRAGWSRTGRPGSRRSRPPRRRAGRACAQFYRPPAAPRTP